MASIFYMTSACALQFQLKGHEHRSPPDVDDDTNGWAENLTEVPEFTVMPRTIFL